jgi:sugar lactone lactonase YvrE
MSKRFLIAVLTLAATIVAGTQLGATAQPPAQPKVVVDHLNNPRGLLLRGRSLYIAEAGRAGDTCFGAGPEGEMCAGFTGSITRYRRGRKRRIATGLLSLGGRDGTFTTGPDDVTIGRTGRLYTVIAGNNQTAPPSAPRAARRQLGNVLQLLRRNRRRIVARIDDFEFANDPDRQGKDSNPYALVATRRGRLYVVDAAGNDLLRASRRRVSLTAVFPNVRRGRMQGQSVPTSVRQGPDGALYVGELTGEGAPPRSARVWRVVPGQPPRVFVRRFYGITGLAFGPDGSLYVSEFSTDPSGQNPAGDVIRVRPNGRRVTIGTGQLNFPTGIAVSRRGFVYVSNWSTLPSRTPPGPPWGGANGQVVRFSPAQAGG